jgi:hypothetical protein
MKRAVGILWLMIISIAQPATAQPHPRGAAMLAAMAARHPTFW